MLPLEDAKLYADASDLILGQHSFEQLAYVIFCGESTTGCTWPIPCGPSVCAVYRRDRSIAIAHGLEALYELTSLRRGRRMRRQQD